MPVIHAIGNIMFISIGHRIDLKKAIDFTLKACTVYKIPQPVREAHAAAGLKE